MSPTHPIHQVHLKQHLSVLWHWACCKRSLNEQERTSCPEEFGRITICFKSTAQDSLCVCVCEWNYITPLQTPEHRRDSEGGQTPPLPRRHSPHFWLDLSTDLDVTHLSVITTRADLRAHQPYFSNLRPDKVTVCWVNCMLCQFLLILSVVHLANSVWWID